MINEFQSASARRKAELKLKQDLEDDETKRKQDAAKELQSLYIKKKKLIELQSEELADIDKEIKKLKNQN